MMIEVTYYSPFMLTRPQADKLGLPRMVYYHQQINIQKSAIKWMRKNYNSIKLKDSTKNTTPNTEMFVEGLGKVLVKEDRKEIRDRV